MRECFLTYSTSYDTEYVYVGFNRCGETFWGFDMKHNRAVPDMVTIAKGMGNGVGIIGAVITRRGIAEAFSTKMVSSRSSICTALLCP